MGCNPSFDRVAALNTVRSAPVSTRNSAGCQNLSLVKISPRITGRTTPSSHSSHSPLICIDTSHFLARDVANKATVVFGMGRSSQGPGLFRGIQQTALRQQSLHICHDSVCTL